MNENQSLLPPSRHPLPSVKESVKRLIGHSFDLAGTSGISAGLYATYMLAFQCNEENLKTCSASIGVESLYIAMGFGYMHFLLRLLSRQPSLSRAKFTKKLSRFTRHLRNILGSHIFYLNLTAFLHTKIAQAIEGKTEVDINEIGFVVFEALPSLLMAIGAYPPLRYLIREKYFKKSPEDPRGTKMKIGDMTLELFNGFAPGRQIMSDFEDIVDKIGGLSLHQSNGGSWARWGVGLGYGIALSILCWYYTPLTSGKEIFHTELPGIVQSGVMTANFLIMLTLGVLNSPYPHKIVHGVMLGALLAFDAVAAIIRHKCCPRPIQEDTEKAPEPSAIPTSFVGPRESSINVESVGRHMLTANLGGAQRAAPLVSGASAPKATGLRLQPPGQHQ